MSNVAFPNRFQQDLVAGKRQVLKELELERDGPVRRKAFPAVPVTVEYSIMPLGTTLATTVDALTRRAEDNIEAVLRSRKRYDDRK